MYALCKLEYIRGESMKKLLLSSVAALSVMAVVGPANAADKLKLDLSGFFVGSAAYVDQKLDAGTRDYAFGSDSEIHFTGAMTLDNGLIVGFHAEGKLEEDVGGASRGLPPEAGQDFIQESFVFFEGAFGRIEFGKQDGIGHQMTTTGPTIFAGNTLNDAQLDASGLMTINTDNTVNNGLDEFERKIIYFTPVIAGFQAGISFTPDADGFQGSAFDPRTNTTTGASTQEEIIEVGASYNYVFEGTDMGDVSVGLSGTYITADETSTTLGFPDDLESWNVGGQIGVAGFTVGGSYKDSNFGSTFVDYNAWEVSGTYELGPWGFLLGYGEDKTDFPLAGFDFETMAVQGGVDFMLGAGVSLGGGVQYVESDSSLIFVPDDDATVVFIETMVSF